MKTTIGTYDPISRSVPVTFESGDIRHDRSVNACLKDGMYDAELTAKRVEDVARGVAAKIEAGAITAAVDTQPEDALNEAT